jgi:L-lactate utilization protein LutC
MSSVVNNPDRNSDARDAILGSIRSHLAASVSHDERERVSHAVHISGAATGIAAVNDTHPDSPVELFQQNLEAVDGHCIVAQGETEIVQALTRIISDAQQTRLRAKRIAISDNPLVDRLIRLTDLDVDELEVTPDATELFGFDVGISTAQAAIAETGTLVMDSSREQHRLVSLIPPIHIAIVEASTIHRTLGEALAQLRHDEEVSPVVTLITGPSRTADIELTLAIGVHGPQELYVIVNQGP